MKFRITTVELSAKAGQMSDEAWAARLGATLLFASLATCIRDHINLMQTIFQGMIHRSLLLSKRFPCPYAIMAQESVVKNLVEVGAPKAVPCMHAYYTHMQY